MSKQVRFIQRAQALGFTLTEVGGLLRLDEACTCAQTQALAAYKLELIKQKLGELVLQCATGGSGAARPIIDVLVQG